VVRTGDGQLALGRALAGRGAWLCANNLACVDAAAKRDAFGRALRAPVAATAVDSLRTTLRNRARMMG
jgi:predicted RNA-binding protein YlxR (DUF448 family)